MDFEVARTPSYLGPFATKFACLVLAALVCRWTVCFQLGFLSGRGGFGSPLSHPISNRVPATSSEHKALMDGRCNPKSVGSHWNSFRTGSGISGLQKSHAQLMSAARWHRKSKPADELQFHFSWPFPKQGQVCLGALEFRGDGMDGA